MTGYAPNSSAPSEDKEYASLSSGLLARKGEALPAVDADAHEGVDINFAMTMAPANSAGARKSADESKIISLKRRALQKKAAQRRSAKIKIIRARSGQSDVIASTSVAVESPAPVSAPAPEAPALKPEPPDAADFGPAPDAWRLPPTPPAPRPARAPVETTPPDAFYAPVDEEADAPVNAAPTIKEARSPMATVKFKIPARDFVRMRAAARDLELSGPSLIREALECYLDANDVGAVSDDEYERELARLRALVQRRRAQGL